MREKQAIELIGAIDTDPAKAGRDLGELVGAPDAPWGISVSSDPDLLQQAEPDIVVHSTASSLPAVAGQLLACLAAESSVISTCEELAYPYRKYPQLAAQLDSEAKESGVALVGTGVNPGFVMDKLVLTLAAAAQRVDSARVLRIVDAGQRRLPLQKKVGAGMTVAGFNEQVVAGRIKHHGLPESVAMVSDNLGFDVDEIIETIEPIVAPAAVTTPFLHVASGLVAGVHQIARGMAAGQEKIYMELQMFVGAQNPRDTIELRGEPHLALRIPGGTHGDLATIAIIVNSIPALLAAPAGLRTANELPMSYFPPAALP